MIPRTGRRPGLPATSSAVAASPGPPPPPPAAGADGQRPVPAKTSVGRFLQRVSVHNFWIVVLLIVIVGRLGDWGPFVAGKVPVLKIAFVIAALYVNRVSFAYAPVRLWSLPIARLAISFFVLMIASFAFSVYHTATFTSSYVAVIYLITFAMLVKTTQTQKDIDNLLVGLAVAGAALAVWEIVSFRGGRATITGTNANDLAYSITTLLPIVLVLRGRAWGWRRLTLTGLALLMCMAVLLTASRGGVVGVMVVLLAATFFPLDLGKTGWLKRRNIGKVLAVLGLAAALGTVMFRFLPQETQERLLTLIHPSEDYNNSTTLNSSRRVIWTRDLRLAFERPIGYGAGTATAVDGIYGHGQYRTAHNSVIQAFLELGALGLYLYLASYFVAWRDLGRISNARPRDGPTAEGAKVALFARALRVSLLGNFAAGFFLSQAYSGALWMILAISCAFIRINGAHSDLVTGRAADPTPAWRRPSARARVSPARARVSPERAPASRR